MLTNMYPLPHRDDVLAKLPYPRLFLSVSGSHMYGFPSEDSDYDLRGVHILPWENIVGLKRGPEAYDRSEKFGDILMDVVTYDVEKFFRMLLRFNGNALEQTFSRLVIEASDELLELRELAARCITKHSGRHYLGFAVSQWKMFERSAFQVKPVLYVFRVLLTGLHLMRTGQVEPNLRRLNEDHRLGFINDMIELKTNGSEDETLTNVDQKTLAQTFEKLTGDLEEACQNTHLPAYTDAADGLHDLLLRIRYATFEQRVSC